MGKVCVCGAEELSVDTAGRRFTTRDGTVVEQGDVISVDGSAGAVYTGAVPLVDSAVMRFLETGERSAGVVDAVAGALQLQPPEITIELEA